MRTGAIQVKSPSLLPGSTIGLLGGGQLGRMFAFTARRMGYRVHVLDPAEESPAGQICDKKYTHPYEDIAAVKRFAEEVDVITFEFENIPSSTLSALETVRPVHPGKEVLYICQNREREKAFLSAHGFPLAAYRVVDSAASLQAAVADLGFPCVLKTADFGYDGKGQYKIEKEENWEVVWNQFHMPRGVVEAWVNFQKEMSIICARTLNGALCTYPVSENIQTHHILDYSIVPARLEQEVKLEVEQLARKITEALGVVGLLAVEFFLTSEGRVLVNELAPRPHNSGHFSLDACLTSQFEQQLRAVCGLPLGSTKLLSPVVMVNLLGDLWDDETPPDWERILAVPSARLHLYGKSQARKGRKMGHYCILEDNIEIALQKALNLRDLLKLI